MSFEKSSEASEKLPLSNQMRVVYTNVPQKLAPESSDSKGCWFDASHIVFTMGL